jgi:hypothetical protein
MQPSASELRVGDFAWNLRESSLDLRPGMLILVTHIGPPGENFPIQGDIQLFAGTYNGSGYYFLPTDLQKIELEPCDGK